MKNIFSTKPSKITPPDSTSIERPEITFREMVRSFRSLGIENKPILVHSSLKSFGKVQGKADAVVGALLDIYDTVVMPTFTYKSLIVPEKGPANNAINYGQYVDRNKMAEFFHPDMPADKLMGIIPETLRQHPNAKRSGHPVLSFSGVNAQEYLDKQTLSEPFAPIAAMYDNDGWVILAGVNHNSNTTIHLGERLAGRKMYIRWALLSDMIVQCPNFPFCSDGFNTIQPLMDPFTRKAQIGSAFIQAMPMHELVETTRQLIQSDPTALLCFRTDCQACNTTRQYLQQRKK